METFQKTVQKLSLLINEVGKLASKVSKFQEQTFAPKQSTKLITLAASQFYLTRLSKKVSYHFWLKFWESSTYIHRYNDSGSLVHT
jgi:hypothetical protein